MADEEDENVPKTKKEKDKDSGLPELAPGDVINPIEYKMFDPANMQKTLAVPQRTAYSFQKELSGTLQKRLENIQIKVGSDDAHPITERRIDMELIAGWQPWEEVDPISGQLLELRAMMAGTPKDSVVEAPAEVKPPPPQVPAAPPAKPAGPQKQSVPGAAKVSVPRTAKTSVPGTAKPSAPVPTVPPTATVTPAVVAVPTPAAKHVVPPHQAHVHITPSVLALMRGALPKAKVEDKSAMPPVNRRNAATPKPFESALKAQERAEYGDYYETIEKLDKRWKDAIGKRMSELRPVDKTADTLKGKDGKGLAQKKRVSLAPGMLTEGGGRDKPEASVAPSGFLNRGIAVPSSVKKPQGPRRPAGVPVFLDGVINYFTEAVSPDCNLESWLAPVSIQPVFKIRDIPPEIENTIVTIARVTHSKFIDDQGIAMHIRSALEKHHGYACKWHVVVGRKFGMQVNSDKGNFLFMYIGHLGYVIFRTFG